MHVLVTADSVGGVWTYTRELVTGLARRGVTVTLVSMGEIPSAEETEWLEALDNVDFRPTGFRLEWMKDSHDDLEAASEVLLSIIREVKPDLLHFSQFYFGALQCEIPRIVVAHSDVISWWRSVHGVEPKNDEWITWYRGIVSNGLESATAVVAPSGWMLTALEQNYTRPKHASVIYNGRTPTSFLPHMSKEVSAVSVGRIWDLGKNSTLLTKIDPAVLVYLAGPNQEPENPMNRKNMAHSAKVRFWGVQSEKQLRLLYGKASIYIATSRYEPFGLAPLEAALSRCAILASDIPTFKEIWGDCAFYFKNNDPGSLEEALKQLSSDQELCATYAHLAYERARSRFTASRMVDEYLHLYSALVPTGVMAA